MGLQVDGVSYLLQEIYGIENKYNTQDSKVRAPIPQVKDASLRGVSDGSIPISQPASRGSSLVPPLPFPKHWSSS